MIVMITGSCEFKNGVMEEVRTDVYRELDELRQTGPEMTLISGGARGVDRIGEQWARERGVGLVVYKPDYKRHRRGAPLVRNKAMVEACDGVVAFWNGTSKETKHVLEHARRKLLGCSEYS